MRRPLLMKGDVTSLDTVSCVQGHGLLCGAFNGAFKVKFKLPPTVYRHGRSGLCALKMLPRARPC